MINRMRTVGIFALSCCLLPACGTLPSAESPGGFDIADVVSQIKAALVTTQKELQGQAMPPLKQVRVSLTLANKSQTAGEVSFWVVAGGASESTEESQTVTFTLTPPSYREAEPVAARDLYEALVEAILGAAQAAHTAQRAAIDGQPKLELSSVTTTVKFAITEAAEGKIGFEAAGLTLGGKRSDAVTGAHEIHLSFQ